MLGLARRHHQTAVRPYFSPERSGGKIIGQGLSGWQVADKIEELRFLWLASMRRIFSAIKMSSGGAGRRE